jgi:hypothetical protein
MLNVVAHSLARDAAYYGASSATFHGFTLRAMRYGKGRRGIVVLQVKHMDALVAKQVAPLGKLLKESVHD